MAKRYPLIIARGDRDQKEIADSLFELGIKVTQQTISNWETAATTPGNKEMLALEQILNCPKEQLFPDIFDEQAAATA